jgi:fructose-1-phosphate kinase PfkB-like protein
MSQGMDQEAVLRISMACGAANAVLGEVGSVRMEDVRAIEKRIEITTIKR